MSAPTKDDLRREMRAVLAEIDRAIGMPPIPPPPKPAPVKVADHVYRRPKG